jgi:hypothetical protein
LHPSAGHATRVRRLPFTSCRTWRRRQAPQTACAAGDGARAASASAAGVGAEWMGGKADVGLISQQMVHSWGCGCGTGGQGLTFS